MSPNPYTHALLWQALNEIAGGGDDTGALTAQLREAFLAFGSETPCNLNCANRIGIGNIDGGTGPVLGGRSLADIAHMLEDQPMPGGLRAAFPDLTERGWDAFGRLTTLLYVALSRPRRMIRITFGPFPGLEPGARPARPEPPLACAPCPA